MTEFPDVMVDLETTGLAPNRHAIIQIAAVRFNVQTGAVSSDFFDQCLLMPPWRSWLESTRMWWGQQKREILMDIMARAQDHRQVIRAFGDWTRSGGPAVMWAKPLTFEFPFLQSYFDDAEEHFPFDFRTATDCRSYVKGLAFPEQPISDKEVPFEGDAHNALFDTLHQVKWLLLNQEKFGTPGVRVAGATRATVFENAA